ncbi:MAG: FkbM family methyltransferase, partial [Rhodoferax sp.]|nr:FkbM family methyltransferase [Rhodoferax sp.]
GDQIQCLRFVQPLLELGASVGVWVHPAVAPLASRVAGVQEVLTQAPAAATYDYWALMMSLPVRFKAGFDTLPGHYPYIATLADSANTDDTAERLRKRIDRFAQGRLKVGINWAGNPSHPNDRHRSLQVSDIAAWLNMRQIAWVSLQTSRDPATEVWVARGNLLPLGDEIASFGDTAAIIAALDRVISIDSAVAHLAGAMGAPTWLLLPANPDYRWMLERTDSPWYPSIRLWRQDQLGAWAPTLAQVARALRREIGEPVEASADASDQTGNFGDLQVPAAAQFLTLAGHQRLMQGRHGWFVYNRYDQYVGQALQHYGEYAEYEVQLFARILQGHADADAIEVGANMGAQSVPLARMARNLWVFEPQPTVFQTLCANLSLNDVRNTQAFPYGVGEVQGTLVLPLVGYDTEGNFGGVSLLQEGQGMAVRVVTLDEFLPALAPDLRVRLLKVDVEGMERAVLVGARQLIARDRPLLYVENDRIEQSAELIDFARTLGYRLYWHCPLLYNPANFFGSTHSIYPGIAAINMLGVPHELTFDTTGMREVGAAHEHILQGG